MDQTRLPECRRFGKRRSSESDFSGRLLGAPWVVGGEGNTMGGQETRSCAIAKSGSGTMPSQANESAGNVSSGGPCTKGKGETKARRSPCISLPLFLSGRVFASFAHEGEEQGARKTPGRPYEDVSWIGGSFFRGRCGGLGRGSAAWGLPVVLKDILAGMGSSGRDVLRVRGFLD